ncbi:hypothetical protein DPEC_G00275140 [Dallia pectoralis]|uniref:Uncharacterized protein n=1 Tax=Dallia pectoralis TaxID=75939 RepID=A0ACC2FL79_DALPE|nr:hypothetical protein DPEC_G00275140 [Dallia pectoralis]
MPHMGNSAYITKTRSSGLLGEKMSNSMTTTGVVEVTHVHPTDKVIDVSGVSPPGQTVYGVTPPGQTVHGVLKSFRTGQPKALGTVQIMIGLVMLLIGIVMASSPHLDNIGVVSGIFFWGSIIFIIAGSLTVAAGNNLNKCLVVSSLVINVIALIIALVCVVIYSADAAGILLRNSCPNTSGTNNIPSNPGNTQSNPSNPGDKPSHSDDSSGESSGGEGHRSANLLSLASTCQPYWGRSQGISSVLVILSLLEFIVCICVTSIACIAVCPCCCCHATKKVMIVGEPKSVPDDDKVPASNAPFPPDYEIVKSEKDLEGGGMSMEFHQYDQPPKYTSISR